MRFTHLTVFCGFLILSLCVSVAQADVQSTVPEPGLSIILEEIATGMTSPLGMAVPNDGTNRLFILDQIGQVRIIAGGVLLATPFLDISDRMVTQNTGFDERGLLGMAFHPDYVSNGRFFIFYSAPTTTPGMNCRSTIAEYTVSESDPNIANRTEKILLTADKPQFNHNGGQLAFGPDDYLYMSLGDGGGAGDQHGAFGNAQDIEVILGKILRIDVDSGTPYSVPPDNPFVGESGVDEIWAYGLRNPWRFSFDMAGSNRLFCPDVGQNIYEEVNIIESGGNYGWRPMEGFHCFNPVSGCNPPAFEQPILEYDHSLGIGVIGGYVYRGAQYPKLVGKYIFGDYSQPGFGGDGRLFYAEEIIPEQWKMSEFVTNGGPGSGFGDYILGFGQDLGGEVYILSNQSVGPAGNTGRVHRIHLDEPSVNQVMTYAAILSGEEEVPPIPSEGRGSCLLTLNAAKTQIAFRLNVFGLENMISSHIHLGFPGENGGIVYPLSSGPFVSPITGTIAINAQDVANLESGRWYVNVHTMENQAGEIRGRVARQPLKLQADLRGTHQTTPIEDAPPGKAVFMLSDDLTSLDYSVKICDIDNAISSHIHDGTEEEDGPIIYTLSAGPFAEEVTGTISSIPISFIDQLLAEGYYVNVHTTDHQPGYIRDQIRFVGARTEESFITSLTGMEEVDPVMTDAWGVSLITVNPARTQFDYHLVEEGLEDILFAHIHRGAVGVNGPIVHTLAPSSFVNYVTGTLDTTQADYRDLVAGNFYANIHTQDYTGGEIRGQFIDAPLLFTGQMTADEEVDPGTTEITGSFQLLLSEDLEELEFLLMEDGLSDILYSHIHRAPRGLAGPIVYPLTLTFSGRAYGKVESEFQCDDVDDLLLENFYVNVHTSDDPAGAIRGQIGYPEAHTPIPPTATPTMTPTDTATPTETPTMTPTGTLLPTHTPTQTPTSLPTAIISFTDLNTDGFVDDTDLILLMRDWHTIVHQPIEP